MRDYLAVLFLVIILAVPWAFANYPAGMNALVSAVENAGNQLAAVILLTIRVHRRDTIE